MQTDSSSAAANAVSDAFESHFRPIFYTCFVFKRFKQFQTEITSTHLPKFGPWTCNAVSVIFL